MRLLRALGIGALLWVLIFVEISITMIGLKLSDFTTYVIHYILLVPMTIFCAWLYYKSRDKINGFLLGFVIVLVGIALDMIVTVPLFVKSYSLYFSSFYLIAGLIEGVIVVGIYDLVRKR